MTNRQKKKAWNHLRRFQPIIKRIRRGQLSIQSWVIFSRLIQIRLKFKINFKRMKEEAQTGKQIRQAYRFAMAAGIYEASAGQYAKQYQDAIPANKWISTKMRDENERTN